jgi:hypothetical protein
VSAICGDPAKRGVIQRELQGATGLGARELAFPPPNDCSSTRSPPGRSRSRRAFTRSPTRPSWRSTPRCSRGTGCSARSSGRRAVVPHVHQRPRDRRSSGSDVAPREVGSHRRKGRQVEQPPRADRVDPSLTPRSRGRARARRRDDRADLPRRRFDPQSAATTQRLACSSSQRSGRRARRADDRRRPSARDRCCTTWSVTSHFASSQTSALGSPACSRRW